MSAQPQILVGIASFGNFRVVGRWSLNLVAFLGTIGMASANPGASPQFLGAGAPIEAPSGASDLCATYTWACKRIGAGPVSTKATLALARDVNRDVNRAVRPISDRRQYGQEERWTLPSARGGDCEDIALLKKKRLIQRGVPAEHLLLATVYSRRTGPHAVLILRLEDGDYVLDNLERTIKHWRQTDYNFMRMQNPRAPSSWTLVSTH